MTHSRNVAPHGWYVASYLLRFIELAEEGNDDPEKRFVTWENTILVKARSMNEAYEKAVKVAMKETEPYKGGPDGVDVRCVFEGITDLLPIYEELADGAEIMWAKHAPRKLRNIRQRARTKDELQQ
ncbi:DUF4288 domain-containing protein [Ideonella sp. B7]|uniref:DUF4288 domain-containing protein n=1 Tax=Ideonella benzenivorans TaxID=2831643 RepID=UPI001CEDB1A0|nr:DUF4288 domain-containing protein [Ideonella benzenivorans]MCA6218019.1 DUF4288 domain-containing protein [Ideonella benzenivorans]